MNWRTTAIKDEWDRLRGLVENQLADAFAAADNDPSAVDTVLGEVTESVKRLENWREMTEATDQALLNAERQRVVEGNEVVQKVCAEYVEAARLHQAVPMEEPTRRAEANVKAEAAKRRRDKLIAENMRPIGTLRREAGITGR